jgi:PAS domain S-box-containing protein
MNIANGAISVPILLVDDRPENLLSLEELLCDREYELVRALSGNEALRQTLKQDFALVLLDVQMPGMDGFETAELMRANPKTRHIPIIFVTAGFKDLQFQFKGYDAGAVDYLAKPIEPVFLQNKVRIFAELYHQRRVLELHNNHLEELVAERTAELEQSAARLKAGNDELQYKNRELRATEELLRSQITEFVETHDQLLATEEMLQVQIEEYQGGQIRLKEANRNLQTLFDVMPLGIIVSSFPDCTILEINQTFTDTIGFSMEQAVGKTVVELGIWEDGEQFNSFLGLIHEQQGVSRFVADIKNVQGESRNVYLFSTHLNFGEDTCLLIVILDVTEQKLMEARIRQTQKMEVVGQLAGGVAHDFNNMLAAISGSAELMERHVSGNQSAMKLLGNIQTAASRSAELTGQLLTFSRKGQKNTMPTCINSTIHDVIALLERTIDKRISLSTRLAAKNSCVIGDPGLLQNALLNLGVNARDAMPDGGVIAFATANVELDAIYCATGSFDISPGPYIEIAVTDTGIGMDKDILQHIFEPFYTTKEIGKGTGLGLAAVYGTVADHHGCINVYSEPGLGSVFKLYLPLSGEWKKDLVVVREEMLQGAGGILLVDDEELLRGVGKELLEELGYQVFLAENGEQALAVYEAEREHICLVILDVIMPIVGGKETLQVLISINPAVKVLMSSGFHQDETNESFTGLGAKGFLQKPYGKHDLYRAVSGAINSAV